MISLKQAHQRIQSRSLTNYIYPKKVENVLIYEKLTPYAYHKSRQRKLNPHNFGNLPLLMRANMEHDANMRIVNKTLEEDCGIKSENIRHIKTRQEGYDLMKKRRNDPLFEPFKPDLIIATGGDGTFLRASHLLDDKLGTLETPILGINTNPGMSVGRLCINTNGLKLHDIVKMAVDKDAGDSLKVLKRSRIKVTMSSRTRSDFYTHDFHHDNIPLDAPKHSIRKSSSLDDPEIYNTMNLPVMALNDVFIGERAASMVTNLEINYRYPNNNDWVQHHSQKNSGLIICTGTGSTGWSKSSNYICPETMKTVIEQLKLECNCRDDAESLKNIDINKFADQVNATRTVFSPEDNILGVTFREPINSKISAGNDGNFINVSTLKAKSKLTYWKYLGFYLIGHKE